MGPLFVTLWAWLRLPVATMLLMLALEPQETYLDLTGRNAHYFYFGRRMPIEVGAPYNLAHPEQQRRAVARLEAAPPPVALLEASNFNFDGHTPALRSHLLYRWAVSTYEPVLLGGHIFGVQPARLSRLPPEAFDLPFFAADYSDENWQAGVHRQRPGFFVADLATAQVLEVGDQVRFAGSGARQVEAIEGRNIWMAGPLLDPALDGHPHPNGIPEDAREDLARQRKAILFDRAFRVADLRALPVAWGHSFDKLEDRMDLVSHLPLEGARTHNMQPRPDGGFVPTGPDPQIGWDVGHLGLGGGEAGLLVFRFACEQNGGPPPRLQVYWADAGTAGPTEAESVSFAAADGWLIVPLDSQPRWLLSPHIRELRIDLMDPSSCASVSIDEFSLRQRKDVEAVR